MSQALTVQSQDLIAFDAAKLKLIRDTVAKDLEPLEFELFMAVSKARGLDPILKQIHAVKRKDKKTGQFKMTIQVGIDGFRLIASRTGEYAGCDAATFEREASGHPIRCKFTVYRIVKGVRCAFTATARWAEYCPQGDGDFMWSKMPETMLSKVCEALALRKAFPADLSGLYVDEEMHQADAKPLVSSPTHAPAEVKPVREVSEAPAPRPSARDAEPLPPSVLTQSAQSGIAQIVNAAFVSQRDKDPGDYVITFGKKYAGMTLRSIPLDELENYVDWLEGSAASKGLPLSAETMNLKVAVGRFRNSTAPSEPTDSWLNEEMPDWSKP